MRSTTATRTSTDSAEAMPSAPAHRAAGHHAGALRRHAARHHRAPGRRTRAELGDAPRRRRRRRGRPRRRATATTSSAPSRDFERQGLDGLLVVMLTYGPGMRVSRALLAHAGCRSAWPTSSPSPGSPPTWDMADLTYNQGIHGAQDTANAMVRAGRPFHVVTDDWHADSFAEAVGGWARAAAAVSRWRALKVAVFGYAMNGMGDIRVDVHALLRALGPQVDALAPGRAAPRHAGRRRRRRARADGRRGRALRDRPAPAATRSARTTRACSSASRRCCATAATAPTRPTSTPSARTAASRGCRSPPPRASWPRATATAPRATR